MPLVADGMRVGLGTGTTAYWFILGLAERVRQGLRVRAVATSLASVALAREHGMPVEELGADGLDLAVDGADCVDPALRLIKGRGGAMLREKIVAASASRFVVIVDDGKCAPVLRGRVPVEVIRFGSERTLAVLSERTSLRFAVRVDDAGAPVITDNGNLIADSEDVAVRRSGWACSCHRAHPRCRRARAVPGVERSRARRARGRHGRPADGVLDRVRRYSRHGRIAQLVRAPRLHRGGRGFEPCSAQVG